VAFDACLIQEVSVKILYMVETGRLLLVVNGVVISQVLERFCVLAV
jgi:hypothetical protein